MADLWYPGARKWSGNPNVTGYTDSYAASVGYEGNGRFGPKRGSVNHSAEGTNWDVIHDLLLTKSWTFTIGYDRVEQHHPWNVNCWHCTDTDDDGGIMGNFELVGKEHLGMAGQPLTPYQVQETIKLDRWLAAQNGRDTFRRFDGWEPNEAGVWVECEHNEVSNTHTACPSGRIPWPVIMAALQEDTMSQEQVDALNQRIDLLGAGLTKLASDQRDLLRFMSEVAKALARKDAEFAQVDTQIASRLAALEATGP